MDNRLESPLRKRFDRAWSIVPWDAHKILENKVELVTDNTNHIKIPGIPIINTSPLYFIGLLEKGYYIYLHQAALYELGEEATEQIILTLLAYAVLGIPENFILEANHDFNLFDNHSAMERTVHRMCKLSELGKGLALRWLIKDMLDQVLLLPSHLEIEGLHDLLKQVDQSILFYKQADGTSMPISNMYDDVDILENLRDFEYGKASDATEHFVENYGGYLGLGDYNCNKEVEED